MNRIDWTEILTTLTKSRIVLYGLVIALFLLILVVTSQLLESPTMVNMPSLKPGAVPDIVPVNRIEELVVNSSLLQSKTDMFSPFFTDRFKIPQAPSTNEPSSQQPPPPQFYTLSVKYMGMIENSSGFKQAFFMVNSNFVKATNSMLISTNIVVEDFSPKQAILICPNGTNIIPFNKDCSIQLPIK